MNRLIVPILTACALGVPAAGADGPMAEPAARAWVVADVVLARHLKPPLRQQMLLAGLESMAASAWVATPRDLARRVSNLSTPDQLATLMAEVLAGPKLVVSDPMPEKFDAMPSMARTPEDAFFQGLGSVVPGGAILLPEKERKVQESFEANLYVGVQIKLGFDAELKRPVFLEIFEGGPADNAGAKARDVIEEVGGESTVGMSLGGVVDRLRGQEGTDVLVRFRRPETGEEFNRPMTRGRLARSTIQGLSPLPGKRWAVRFDGPAPIGYLKITEVSGSTPQELRAFAAQLESEGAKALVLDLRGVTGAGFHPTILLADALLDGGIIGRVKSVDGEKTYRAEPDALFRDWPMVVLASGKSEPEVAWLCHALRDNQRATIVGEPTLASDPVVTESVALPGGEWSVRIATGRLERGDGQPLVLRSRMGLGREAIGEIAERSQRFLKLMDQDKAPKAETNKKMVDRKPAGDLDLDKAREVLAETLKSNG